MSQLNSHYPFLASPDHLSTAGSRVSGTHSVLECFINLVYTLTFHPVCKLLTNQTPLPVSRVSSIHGVCEWVGVDMLIRTLKSYTYVSHPSSSASPPHVYMDRLFLWHVCFLATVKSTKGGGWEWKQTLKFLPLSLLYKLVLAYKQEVETNFFQFFPWYTCFPFLCLLFNCHCYFGLLSSWCRFFPLSACRFLLSAVFSIEERKRWLPLPHPHPQLFLPQATSDHLWSKRKSRKFHKNFPRFKDGTREGLALKWKKAASFYRTNSSCLGHRLQLQLRTCQRRSCHSTGNGSSDGCGVSGNLLEMRLPRPCSRPIESDTLGAGRGGTQPSVFSRFLQMVRGMFYSTGFQSERVTFNSQLCRALAVRTGEVP